MRGPSVRSVVDLASAILFTVSERFKFFAVVLLLLTLPMQSMAAASMLVCNGDDHSTWLTTIVNGEGHSDAGNGASSLSHQHAAHAANDHHPGTIESIVVGAGDDKHPAASCSSCSDCCCAASLPSPGQSMLAAIGSSGAAVSTIAQPVSGYVPDRLDRPPRSTLV